MTKGADDLARPEAGHRQQAAYRLGAPEGWDLSPRASQGELPRRPLTPPPRKFSRSEPQSKTKGRGEEGATVPSNHRRPPGPEPPAGARAGALARLLARCSAGRGPRPGQPPVPGLPAAARDRSRGSSRGAAGDGKTRWPHPSSLLLHPSLRVPAAWPPSAGARGGRGPGSSGLTPGKGLPLSKGHHPSAVPGLGLVPPIPRPRGWRWGAAPNLGR